MDARPLRSLLRQSGPVAKLGARRLIGRKSPFQVTFSLTNRCNFHCVYCDIPIQRRDEMSTSELCAAIDELRDAGMGRASLIGGEPLLRKDAGEIIAHFARRSVHTAMNTNGWFIEERIDEVRSLDLVCITLDGPPEVHDAQRKKGSYERAVEAIEILRAAGVAVVTMTVLTPEGINTIDHVLDVARRTGVRAFFQLEHHARCDVDKPIAIRLSRTSIEDIAREILARKREGQPVGNSVELLERHRDGRRILGDCETCYAGRYYAYILSDGTIAPCLLTQWQQTVGNGRTQGFVRAFHALREPRGPGCSCVPTHEVNRVLSFDPSAIWHAMDVVQPLRANG